MLPISIQFQAYIPKSLGKPLLSYFEQDHRLNLLRNKEEFIRSLKEKDQEGFTWFPEPLGSVINYYSATDNVDIHNRHSNKHTARLALHIEIEPEKIGKYDSANNIFVHPKHGNKWGGTNSQHSGESHRVQAYIKRMPFYEDMPRASNRDIYVGICDDVIDTKRADEDPWDVSIANSKKNPFSGGENDVTTIKISGSAGYPFLKRIAPNIDFELEIELYKNLNGASIDLHVDGNHNNFPAYELIINQNVVYLYNPADHGYSGPNVINLNTSKSFHATEWIRLNDYEVENLKNTRF